MWPIFVISLDDATVRRARFFARLHAIGLDARVIPAVDGRNGLLPADDAKVDRDSARAFYRRDITDAEFACTLSHRRAYEALLASDHPGAIILEDDAVPAPGFRAFLEGEGYLAAEMIDFHYIGAILWPFWSVRPTPATRGRRFLSLPHLCTGYSITREAARRILGASAKVNRLADWPVDIRRLGALGIQPQLISADPEAGSTIEEKRAEAIGQGTGRWRLRGPPSRGEL